MDDGETPGGRVFHRGPGVQGRSHGRPEDCSSDPVVVISWVNCIPSPTVGIKHQERCGANDWCHHPAKPAARFSMPFDHSHGESSYVRKPRWSEFG
jgi:hypothetical protein